MHEAGKGSGLKILLYYKTEHGERQSAGIVLENRATGFKK
jgi:hypothetical protein